MATDESARAAVVTAAEIARLAGVTRAAVSNWRRRHPDFPHPAAGTATSPLFALAEVQQWLDRQGKGRETSDEVDLWHELRAQYGDDLLTALGAVGAQLLGTAAERPLAEPAAAAVTALSAERGTQALYADLVERCITSTSRSGGEQMTTLALERIVAAFAGPVGRANGAANGTVSTVYDPACGIGTLLLTVIPGAHGYGQELNPATAAIAGFRARLDGRAITVACGDSLREDAFPDLRADLVVCEPPVGVADWGRDELLLDPRWDLGVPPRSESELAWVQHCYAHTAPGGRALLVLPASVAYRKAGRRIRAELVRRGLLTSVVALPPGLMSSHSLPVNLWILQRPVRGTLDPMHVRMIDLNTADPDDIGTKNGAPTPEQIADIPSIDLLDDDVDLSPSRYVTPHHSDYPVEYAALRERIQSLARDLLDLLPVLPAGPGRIEAAPMGLGDLVRGGLVDLDGTVATSRTDQLDTDCLRGFLRSAANTRRSTTASGTLRLSASGAQLPQMDIGLQREYGEAFRRLAAFEELLREAAAIGGRASTLAYDGLTTGALLPPSATSDLSGKSKSQKAQEQ
ncbi:N-6 DNA methylase [Streptomyces phaeochromogenes]|uniref:N-6 DNA methylase n=1 Tax=Streptomyces phaeochromogenes TaxID=1923 RepID=UPI002DDBE3C2|nr:N-6 DNA methylase [Streptomyces phaeochromogenes]WRZ28054.1 SAM-dependent methyltransferase [Streptomyces phaeochromogenes]